jgi:hypothetical protein
MARNALTPDEAVRILLDVVDQIQQYSPKTLVKQLYDRRGGQEDRKKFFA